MAQSIKEIRSKLEEKYGFSKEQLKAGKKELRMQLDKLESSEAVEDLIQLADFGSAEEVDESEFLENSEVGIPSIESEQWADYVMDKFRNDEMENGNPTCDGLRRVTELLVGPIIGRDVAIHQSPNIENHGTSTVVCSVRVLNNIENHFLYGHELREQDAADVNKFNTQKPYYLHATATATTRAEARALRKILRLRKVVAAEELAGEISDDYVDAWKPSDPADEEQINLLDVVCQRCNLNVMQYINSGESTYHSPYELSKDKAQSMIQHLNKIQQEKVTSPVGVGQYDSNWRE